MRHYELCLPIFTFMLVSMSITSMSSADSPAQPAKVDADGEKNAATVLVLSPAAEPVPALELQLLPPFLGQRPGNAAVHYGKVYAEQLTFLSDKATWSRIRAVLDTPIDKIEVTEVDQRLLASRSIFEPLERAAQCERCDWQLPLRDTPYWEILLPEVQQSRSCARFLAARARLQIKQRDFDGAIRTLQSGYALARHVSDSPVIVSTLVGIAIAHTMSDQVRAMSQQPGAPNLYWALASLPQPLSKYRRGLEAERNGIYLQFPELQHPEDSKRSEAYWKTILKQAWEQTQEFNQPAKGQPTDTLTTFVSRAYPAGKKSLIAGGMDDDTVESMPAAQVVLLHSLRAYERIRDEQFRWAYLPYPVAARKLAELDAKLQQEIKRTDVLPIAALLLPSMGALRQSLVRESREIKVLQAMEAIRMYSAMHAGALPARLEDCPVPVPDDPVTGASFEYDRQGDVATLRGPSLRGAPLNLEIHVAAAKADSQAQ